MTVDLVIFALRDAELHVLLIRRGLPPFAGSWALPGGFVRDGESLEEAARRELRRRPASAMCISSSSTPSAIPSAIPGGDRDGRLLRPADRRVAPLVAGTDAGDAEWMPARKHPPLAFDHERILAYALERLANKLEDTTIGFQLLPRKFTLSHFQRVYEAVLGRTLDKRNFRRKMALVDILKPLDEWVRDQPTRPAQLYRASCPAPPNSQQPRIHDDLGGRFLP